MESGRGRGRPSRDAGTPPDPGQKLDEVDTHPRPDVFRYWTETGEVPLPGPMPDGTTAAATGDDASPFGRQPRGHVEPRRGRGRSDALRGRNAGRRHKRPVGVAVECPTDALGHMAMDDGAPPVGKGRLSGRLLALPRLHGPRIQQIQHPERGPGAGQTQKTEQPSRLEAGCNQGVFQEIRVPPASDPERADRAGRPGHGWWETGRDGSILPFAT